MSDPYLLHIFSETKNVSPFDINMAYEANYDAVIPYCNVALDEVHGLTQDTIFSRRPEGVKRTAIFIGGRDFHLAVDMLNAAKDAMVPPFEVSVLADPSGAITTAAAMVAVAEARLKEHSDSPLRGSKVAIFGGTGPVGTCVGLLAATAGAEVSVVSHQGVGAAQLVSDQCRKKYGLQMKGADGSSPEAIGKILEDSVVIFNTAKAGVQVVDEAHLKHAAKLKVAVDANAVPPSGIACVDAQDKSKVLAMTPRGALGVGALAVGDIKYRVHTGLLEKMYQSEKPVYLAYEESFAYARTLVGF
jgi:methylene-tetrahydromethanopterin dehydrogenase